jgi:hypothetical protein
MKKTQLIKVMPSLYLGCINTANQAAQSMATANALNDLIAKINMGSGCDLVGQIENREYGSGD